MPPLTVTLAYLRNVVFVVLAGFDARDVESEGTSGPDSRRQWANYCRFAIKDEVTRHFATPLRLLTFTASMHNRDH